VLEHRRIVKAVEGGDVAEARQAMSDHLDTIAAYFGGHRSRRGSQRRADS